MAHEVIDQANEKMEASVDAFKRELVKIRTGRASLSLLDGIKVDAYGSQLPLDQVGTLTIPESRMIVIQPWDPQMLPVIEKGILSSDLGLTPANDGKVIRLTIPQLTEERRKELVKQVKKVAEEFKVAVRNVRREANDTLKKMKKDKEISEDDMFRLQEEAQKATDSFISKIDEIAAGKKKRSWRFRPLPQYADSRNYRTAAGSCGHYHGRQRPLGGTAQASTSVRAQGRGGFGAGSGRGGPGNRYPPPDPVRLFHRELAQAGQRGQGVDVPAQDVPAGRTGQHEGKQYPAGLFRPEGPAARRCPYHAGKDH
jgi:ribosome recycling factor